MNSFIGFEDRQAYLVVVDRDEIEAVYMMQHPEKMWIVQLKSGAKLAIAEHEVVDLQNELLGVSSD